MTPDATEAIRQINEIADNTTDGAVRALSTRAVHDITEADSWTRISPAAAPMNGGRACGARLRRRRSTSGFLRPRPCGGTSDDINNHNRRSTL